MQQARMTRRRIVTAAAVALAVTLGPLTALPAVATTTAATEGEAPQAAVLPLRSDARFSGGGPTGFLAYRVVDGKAVFEWTRYETGVTTTLPPGSYAVGRGTDIVRKSNGAVQSLYDMATGADPVVIDTSVLGEGYTTLGTAGSTLVAKKPNTAGGQDLHLVTKPQDTVLGRQVTGLPADAVITRVDIDSPDAALVLYSATVDGTAKSRAAVVDIKTGTVVAEYDAPQVTAYSDTALSATHLAWVETSSLSSNIALAIVTVRRDTGTTERIPLSRAQDVAVDFLGDWLTYGQRGGYDAWVRNPLHALTARSLTTGATVKLLDDFAGPFSGPAGTQMVRGGTLANGEGVYRISAGTDGALVTELVASTGIPTALTAVSENVPTVIDLDRDPVPVSTTWTVSRSRGGVRLELTHQQTGKKTTLEGRTGDAPSTKIVQWDGTFGWGDNILPAPNGAYTWRMTTHPSNGIGPTEKTGTFTVTRKAVPHDFNDNGTPDLLVREYSGQLSLYNTKTPYDAWSAGPAEPLGTGWNIYDRLVSPGNVAGTPHADIVARDKTGALWLYPGTGRTLAPRVRIGTGWQIYDRITGGSDLTGDGKPDLLATDMTGALWLYPGTGNTNAPLGARKQIGTGWGIYNQITATDNIAGAPAGDLVARDKDGNLWQYLGKGDGTLAPRTKISSGWNTYTGLTGFGDANHDGHPDLVANDIQGNAYLYRGTGNWRAPFQAPIRLYHYGPGGWDLTMF
ncbi:FG-GAP repeat domain-containing protein [Streptomyces wedmorensis]